MILTCAEQRRAEAQAAALGLSAGVLMERAGQAVYAEIAGRFRRLRGVRCALLCGRGGNGGDGFVCARLLRENGASPVVLLCDGEPQGGEARAVFERAAAAGVQMADAAEEEAACSLLREAAVIVDAVYGIGFHGGALPGCTARLFAQAAQNAVAFKLSVDIPSGVTGDGGVACPGAFCADVTVAMLAKKPAHLLKAAAAQCGAVVVPPLGLPPEAFEGCGGLRALAQEELAGYLPARGACAHKGSFGRLVVAAGCERYRGAAVLCVRGALCCGAGLVFAASGEKPLEAVAAHCPEAILVDPNNEPKYFADTLRGASAVAAGCGISQTNSARRLVQDVLAQAGGTIVLDADGINLLAEDINLIKGHSRPLILTPHAGEFSRLSGLTVEQTLADRVNCAVRFAREWDAVVLLKSENTVIAAPDGRARLCTIGNAGLAKGGSGDLLCGCVGSFAAMGIEPFWAACLGVWVHSRAADIAACRLPLHSMTASAVADCLPDAVAELAR